MLTLIGLFACANPTGTPTPSSLDDSGSDDTAGDGGDGGGSTADADCPSIAGLVDGRTWTYQGDIVAQEASVTIELTRTLTALGDGVYELVAHQVQTWDDDDSMVLTTDQTRQWRCEGGALFEDYQEATIDQSYGNRFSYGWEFEPPLTLLPADAALGSTWQDTSVGWYWYEDPSAISEVATLQVTSAFTSTQVVADTWESMVAESHEVLTYSGSDYESEVVTSRSWAEGVGVTADGSGAVVLVSYQDR